LLLVINLVELAPGANWIVTEEDDTATRTAPRSCPQHCSFPLSLRSVEGGKRLSQMGISDVRECKPVVCSILLIGHWHNAATRKVAWNKANPLQDFSFHSFI